MKRGKRIEYHGYVITKNASNNYVGKHYNRPEVSGESLEEIKNIIDVRESLIRMCQR